MSFCSLHRTQVKSCVHQHHKAFLEVSRAIPLMEQVCVLGWGSQARQVGWEDLRSDSDQGRGETIHSGSVLS